MASVKESSQVNVNFVPEYVSHNGNHILAVYKGLEATLKDTKKMYQDKVNALLGAWEYVTTSIATSSQDATQEGLIEWVHQHTLNVVLQGDWPKLSPATKTHLSVTLQRCANLLSSHNAAPKCRLLVKLVNDPWGHPILKRIISGSQEITDEEVLDLCHSEMGMVLTMRLEKLCESRCEDLALRLAEVIIRCLNIEGSRLREGSTEEQISYILDVYVSLLYRFKRIQDIIKYLKCLELKDGLLLIRRYAKKDTMSVRIWKQSGKVAELAAQYFLTVAMVKPVSETGSLLKDLMAEWAILHSRVPSVPSTLPNMIRKLILPAESAIHIYTFCEVLVQQFGDCLKPICIELYIRGLTTDMNELEQQKVKHDKEKVHEAELRLSDGFLRLAELVKDNVGVCRECILTAFSLNPTRSCFEKIKAMAVASGKCPNPEKLKPEPNVLSSVCDVKEEYSEKNVVKPEIDIDTGQVSSLTDNNNPRMILNPIYTNVNAEKDPNLRTANCHEVQMDNRVVNYSHVCSEGNQRTHPSNGSTNESLPPETTVGNVRGKTAFSEDTKGPLCSCKNVRSKDVLGQCSKESLEPKSTEMFPSCSREHIGELCAHCGKFIAGRQISSPQEIKSTHTYFSEGINNSAYAKKTCKSDSLDYDVLRQPNKVLDAEALGLTPQLCDDLAVVLSSPRYQTLSWVLDWPDLSTRCEKYLENCEEMRNTAKELKYLNIDYNQFKDWPSDDDRDNYGGIEKGYEQWAELSSDASDQDYEYTSYKKHQRHCDSESDSSVVRKKTRGRKSVNRLVSSESDYDSGGPKKNRPRVTSFSVSDTDTGTQDSKTDSLGSDGFSKNYKDKVRKHEEPVAAKRYRQGNLKDVSHFRVVLKEDHNDGNSDLSNGDVMSLLSHVDESVNKNGSNKYSRAFDSGRRENILNQAEKKSSDPTVLKSLRMFRPHNAKKSSPRDCLTEMLKGNRVHSKESVEFAPMLSTLNLNPRIVLTRTDATHPDLKNLKNQSRNNNDLNCRKNSKNLGFVVNKAQFPMGFPMTGDIKNKHRLQFIAQSVIESELLAKSVPGMNSLDMIVPAPSEPTVQVVQLPQNPTSNQSVTSTDSNQPKVQSSNTTTTTSTSNFMETTASSSERDIAHSSTYTSSGDAELSQSYHSHTGQITSFPAQEEKKPSNAQVSVKYLTKTNEVTDILRSSLSQPVSHSHHVTSIPSQGGSLVEKKHNFQSEVKYLTSASEVNEILRSTLVDSSAQHNQANIAHTSSDGNITPKTRLDNEVKYLTSANEVNEILRSTPVTAHIQKIGQPPVAADIEQNSNSLPQADSSQSSTQSFPIVKAVDLNFFASLISSVGGNTQSSSDTSTAGQDSHMVQLLYKKDGQKFHIKPVICTQSGTRMVSAEASGSTSSQTAAAAASAPTPTSATAADQPQNSLAHALFDDNFRKYSLSSNTVVKTNTPDSPEQVASLPKFQHAFGKSIYNQQQPPASATSDREEPRSVETGDPTPAPPTQTGAPAPAPTPASVTPTVPAPTPAPAISKAVQTTGSGTLGSALGVLMSPLALSASQVVTLASKRPAARAALRVQSPSSLLYDLQPLPAALEAAAQGSGATTRVIASAPAAKPDPRPPDEPPPASAPAPSPAPLKDAGVIRSSASGVSALLAAALQGSARASSTSSAVLSAEPEVCVVESSSSEDEGTDAATQTLISSVPLVQRIALPVLQKAAGARAAQVQAHIQAQARAARPVLHLPGGSLLARASAATLRPGVLPARVPRLTCPSTPAAASSAPGPSPGPVTSTDTLLAHNTMEPSVSSTTLEQLREFESVLEQVTNTSQMKERGSAQATPETLATQQLLLTPAPSAVVDAATEFASAASSASASASASGFPQQFSTVTTRVAYVSQAPTLRSTGTTPGAAAKISSPLVVVTSYCQPVASPALSVTSQSSSSPCVTPAPMTSATANKTPPKPNKSSKSKSLKSSPSSTASKASPVPKPQQKPQEDEQTAQRIYAILDEYAEQLRNSPDLNNKPAPRRRSNPPTNPSQSSKRKKSSQTKMKLLGHQTSSTSIDMSPGADDPRTVGSEDSSSGVVGLSHVQGSPAPSTIAEESQAARTPVVTTPEPVVKTEPCDAGSSATLATVTAERQAPRIIQIDAAGLQSRVIMQEGTSEGEVTVSSATVLAGKPVALPLYVQGGVRQVFVPMAPGLTAAVGGRQVVMSKGAAKVIRVHQVTLPGGALQVAPAAGGVPGAAALVVRQICGGKAAAAAAVGAVGGVSVLGQPTVKQVKFPTSAAVGVSSQSLGGVSAQPPVVLPAAAAAQAAHAAQAAQAASGPALAFDGDDANLERLTSDDVPSDPPYTSGGSHHSAAENAPCVIKTEDANGLHATATNLTTLLCALKTENCQSPEEQRIKKEPMSVDCGEINTIKTETIKQEVDPEMNGNQSLVSTYQCLNLGFARHASVTMRGPNNIQECLSDSCDLKPTIMGLPPCSESESDNAEDSPPPLLRLAPSPDVKGGGATGSDSNGSGGGSTGNDTAPSHVLDKIPTSQLLDAASNSHALHADTLTFAGNAAALDSNSLNDDLFRHEAARVSMGGQVLKKEEDFGSSSCGGGDAGGSRGLGSQDIHSTSLQHSFCAGAGALDSTSSAGLHMRVTATDLPLQRAAGSSASKSDVVSQSKIKGCRSNPAHLDFSSEIGYISSSKFPYQLEYINDVTYQLPSKLPAETRETPWRYVPVVKRVQLIQMRKSDLDRSAELGPLAMESEAEGSPPGAGGCLLDTKAEAPVRRSCAPTALYRKIDGTARLDKPADAQQKLLIEKELKLQKSLSEECEDLGVDEPSTSDLFPEADLLLDTNSSPSFDHNIPDASVTADVQEPDSFSCSNFRSLEYSSSSQDGSQQGSPIDFKRQEGHPSARRIRKRPCVDWKSRVTGREKLRHLNSGSHREGKLHSLAQDCSINGSSHKNEHIHDELSNLQEDSSNGGSKDDMSESTSGTSLESSLHNNKKLMLEKEDDHRTVHTTSQQTLVNSCMSDKDLQEGDSVSKAGILSDAGNLKNFGVVTSKVSLPSNPRTNTYSGCNDDVTNMFDSYASNMMLSSLDVTIPSPVPNLPSLVGNQAQGSACTQDPLPSLTAAQKFSNTYGKRALSGRQDVDRVVKRTRLHRPNQYFNDHIDSQETWESSSSQEKTCADDEDSGSQSRTEGQSSTPDQPNSDVDVVDLSNDSFPSSTTSFLPSATTKIGVTSTESFEKGKSLNINGIDLKDGFGFSVNKDASEGKKVPNNIKRVTRKTVEPDTCEVESSLPGLVGKRRRSASRSNLTHLQKLKSVLQLKSKTYVPTKQSPNLASFSENRKLIVRARKVEECGYLSSVSGFNKPTATAVSPDDEADSVGSPRSQLLDKDSVCSVASSCETQLNTLSVSRRSSLRGHIKKGCTCCSVSPQPAKKKKEILKVEKLSKKGPIKGPVAKKR